MSTPILTVIYPTGHLSRATKTEYLASQKNMLEKEFNSFEKTYHILVFESLLYSPIIEIHNIHDDSNDSIEKLKQRIDQILKFSNSTDSQDYPESSGIPIH